MTVITMSVSAKEICSLPVMNSASTGSLTRSATTTFAALDRYAVAIAVLDKMTTPNAFQRESTERDGVYELSHHYKMKT
jgi:hypothetical protein